MLRYYKGVRRLFRGGENRRRGGREQREAARTYQHRRLWDGPQRPGVAVPTPGMGHGQGRAVPPHSRARPSPLHGDHGRGNSRGCRDGFGFFPKDKGR